VTIEKITVPAKPGLDPVYVYLEDLGPSEGRVTLICYATAWTSWWGGIGKDRLIKDFFIDVGVDYLHSNFGRGNEYKRDQRSLAYLRRVIQSVHDHLREATNE